MITPKNRPIGMQQLLQQIIKQNETLKQQMVDQQAMFQNELQGMREMIKNVELRRQQEENIIEDNNPIIIPEE